MKRALMTFSNPFGLALYDKDQANVADTPGRPDSHRNLRRAMQDIVRACANRTQDWWAKGSRHARPPVRQQDDPDFQELWKAFIARGDELCETTEGNSPDKPKSV